MKCRKCGKTKLCRKKGMCATCYILHGMSKAEERSLLLVDDTLDALRKRPRYYDNRDVRDMPNFDHNPGPSVISL